MVKGKKMSVDELRRHIEALPKEQYEAGECIVSTFLLVYHHSYNSLWPLNDASAQPRIMKSGRSVSRRRAWTVAISARVMSVCMGCPWRAHDRPAPGKLTASSALRSQINPDVQLGAASDTEGGSETAAEPVHGVGDLVRVRPEGAVYRYRKPHLRHPGYIHGAVGEVVEITGRFPDPSRVRGWGRLDWTRLDRLNWAGR
jgi:hypothetical protein